MHGLSLNKLIYPSPTDGVWLKLAHWFWRRRFINFVNVFSLFRNHLPLEKGARGAFHLNKLIYPSPKDDLCQVWFKLAQWFWKRIFKFCLCIFNIWLLPPLAKGPGSSFEQILIPFTQECFVLSLVEIGPMVLEKKMKM